jgi:predicted lipid-binding transport protein (Tim44 family)/uncharacterized membrane protein YgcG
MINRTILGLALALAVLPAGQALARGGGGCIEEGTPVLTPRGYVPVERLSPGDVVLAPAGGVMREATVQAFLRVQPEEYVELEFDGGRLRVTPEHPLAAGKKPGVYRMASALAPGDGLWRWNGEKFAPARLRAVRSVRADRPAYNLLVSPGGTFLAAGLAVHNKGCFLPDTPILRADSTEVPIRDVLPGDRLMAYTPDGAVATAVVREVLTLEVAEYVVVSTPHRALAVTAEHPFYVGDGTFKTLEALAVGDRIRILDSQGLREEPIESIRRILGPVRVYNLRTDEPHTYFASGVAVHNKGGGGGGFHGGGFHSGGSSGGSADWVVPYLFILFFVGIVIIAVYSNRQRSKADEDLDYTYSGADVAPKAEKTAKLLAFIARQDPAFKPEELQRVAHATFLKLQACWQVREYDPMKPLLMPDLYNQHLAQLAAMRQDHEVNMIEGLNVERVNIVNVRYTNEPDHREFTALISAQATDYYVDDRTQERLRGDEAPAKFQEFWTFQLQGGQWLLREIEQTRESDALKHENFFEPMTDAAKKQIMAGEEPAGPAGPWLAKATADKETRTERLLNFLVQTDKLWDRQAMLDRARQVFVSVYEAREGGDPAQVPAADLFPDVAAHLAEEIRQRRQEGVRLSFRNLCVRKAELLLVRNYADNARDEFTVRVSAHAQKTLSRGDRILVEDPYVSPFEEYWTFGRLDGRWKLKEVLPSAKGRRLAGQENVDEGASAGQLEWYYRQKRAV